MRRTVILATLLLFSTAFILSAGPLTNGSFEINGGACAIGAGSGFATLPAGDPCITGWTILNHNIDYISTFWVAADGSRSLDMNGDQGPGSAVQQTFDTIVGLQYVVSFHMAANTGGGPAVKSLTVDVGGAPQSYSFDGTGHSTTNMGWALETFTFTAINTSTALTFTSTTNDLANGPALDAVSVSAPEPGSTGLLLAGVALLILGRRSLRRRLV